MRPWLRWLLLASVLSSALALWWPDSVTQAVARSQAAVSGSPSFALDEPAVNTSAALVTAAALPAALPRNGLEKADFDPFVGVVPPPPPAPPPQALVMPVLVAPPPPPAPTAPPLTYRYLGQMVDPSGKRYVYLGKGDREVPVAVGTLLEDGYVVDAIGADAIQVRYLPLDLRAVINIPMNNDALNP